MHVYTVSEWLGISEKEFDKNADGRHCMKCGKPTTGSWNLCRGHKGAFTKWQNKQIEEDRRKDREFYDIKGR